MSLEQKLREAKVEMEKVKSAPWIDLVLTNEEEAKFLTYSTINLQDMYNLHKGAKKKKRSAIEAQMVAKFQKSTKI